MQPCPTHGKRAYDTWRGSSTSRGYDAAWRRTRMAFLADHPLCTDCYPRLTVATEVHHIAKVADRPDLRLEFDNLRALCKACHSVRTARGE